jgi:hypothetical protein
MYAKQAQDIVRSKLSCSTINDPNAIILDPKFTTRLKSFVSQTWTKHQSLNPVILSRFGWSFLHTDTLICKTCQSQLIIPNDIDQDFLNKYLQLLSSTHKSHCLFQNYQNDQMVYKFRIESPSNTFSILKDRIESIQSKLDQISDIEMESDLQIDDLIPLFNTNSSLILLAILGWKALNEKSLSCSLCYREIPLNYFIESSMKFNPIDQHSWYCPYVRSLHSNDLEPGYKLNIAQLRKLLTTTETETKKYSIKETSKFVRDLLSHPNPTSTPERKSKKSKLV